MNSDTAPPPLSGLRVVDFSRLFAGPLCTMTLADLGADVVKVESPSGDEARYFGPPFLNGHGMNFLALNRGKKSVQLDLKTDAGKAAAVELARSADVVVENFRPGVAERLGIGYDELREHSPGLVYCSISGFGPAEGLGRKPALDIILQALTGVMSRQGGKDGTPQLLCITVADTYAAAQGVQGILAALIARARDGEGQRVDVSLLEGILTSQAYRIICDPESLELPGFDDTVPYRAFRASDGAWFVIAVVSPANWTALCDAIDDPRLTADDERFLSNPLRVENRDALEPLLEDVFGLESQAVWLSRLEERGVPCAPVQTLEELLADPSLLSEGVLSDVVHPDAGAMRILGTPVRLSRSPARIGSPAPVLGEHTSELTSS